jgi:hypothetical protein
MEVIKDVKDIEVGYNMENNVIEILCYSNDATLFAENEDDLQRFLYEFVTGFASIFNMNISIKKI